MKKFLSVIALIMALSLSLACLASCSLFGKPEETTPATDDSNKVTVCWYQGSKVLREEKVEKGTNLTAWTPDPVEGKDVTGWYAEASLTQEFDFETVINEDTDIFAKFTSNVFVADDKS